MVEKKLTKSFLTIDPVNLWVKRIEVPVENPDELEKSDKSIKDKIIKYLIENPNPPDKKVHAFAEKSGIEPDKLEAIIYSILSEIIHKPDIKESEADPKELAMGIKVEMEHTSIPSLAKQIALTHLSELPDYYTRLKKMEGK